MHSPPALSIVAAVARNGVIGRGNALPWKLSADLKRFRALTMGHPIVMGRKTFESIGRALPGRHNIVISGNRAFSAPECSVVATLDDALALAREQSEVFVIGGAQLYREALPRAARLYLTEVQADVAGDTFFPPWPRDAWREITRERAPASEKDDFAADFVVYEPVVASGS